MPNPVQAAAEGLPKTDPLLDFINNWSRLSDQVSGMRDAEAEAFCKDRVGPYELTCRDGQLPEPTTVAGAAAALEKALSFGDMEAQDANLVRAALAFLKRPETADPFLDLLTRYREQDAIWNATPGLTCDEFDALFATTAGPLLDELISETPAITTHRGAVEAIRQTLSEGIEHDGTYSHSAITAALAYFDCTAASNLKTGDL